MILCTLIDCCWRRHHYSETTNFVAPETIGPRHSLCCFSFQPPCTIGVSIVPRRLQFVINQYNNTRTGCVVTVGGCLLQFVSSSGVLWNKLQLRHESCADFRDICAVFWQPCIRGNSESSWNCYVAHEDATERQLRSPLMLPAHQKVLSAVSTIHRG